VLANSKRSIIGEKCKMCKTLKTGLKLMQNRCYVDTYRNRKINCLQDTEINKNSLKGKIYLFRNPQMLFAAVNCLHERLRSETLLIAMGSLLGAYMRIDQ
jgi:hypothetical protein